MSRAALSVLKRNIRRTAVKKKRNKRKKYRSETDQNKEGKNAEKKKEVINVIICGQCDCASAKVHKVYE
jgi:hypothetical protein